MQNPKWSQLRQQSLALRPPGWVGVLPPEPPGSLPQRGLPGTDLKEEVTLLTSGPWFVLLSIPSTFIIALSFKVEHHVGDSVRKILGTRRQADCWAHGNESRMPLLFYRERERWLLHAYWMYFSERLLLSLGKVKYWPVRLPFRQHKGIYKHKSQ